MSVAAAALALTREFDFDGITLTLRPLNYEDLARFSVWVEDRARAGMFRAGEDGIDSKQLLAAFLDNVAAGNYEPGGEAFGRATKSEAGRRKILELMLVAPARTGDAARWRSDTAWDIFAAVKEVPAKTEGEKPTIEPVAFQVALAVCGELNADPSAVAARRRPAPRTRQETPNL